MQLNRADRLLVWLLALLLLALGGFFVCLFYVRYWRWRECIEAALSSCLTPHGDNLTQGGMMWAVPALVFLALGTFVATKARGLRG